MIFLLCTQRGWPVCRIVKRLSNLLLLRQLFYECLPYSPFQVPWLWLSLGNFSVGSEYWPLLLLGCLQSEKKAKKSDCGEWQWSVCVPTSGDCGLGTREGTRTGAECKQTTKTQKCKIPCNWKKQFGGQYRSLKGFTSVFGLNMEQEACIFCSVVQMCLDEGISLVFQVHQKQNMRGVRRQLPQSSFTEESL